MSDEKWKHQKHKLFYFLKYIADSGIYINIHIREERNMSAVVFHFLVSSSNLTATLK